uniref:RRM domain-containing protein n=1 Tax=Romanomermis culicivorax TaxID=13658 RepID=A0A915ILT6_ROMCU
MLGVSMLADQKSKSTINCRNSSSDSSNSRRTLSRSHSSDSSRSRSRSLPRSKSPSGSTSQSTSSRNGGGSRHSGGSRRPVTSRRTAVVGDRRSNNNNNNNDSRRSSQTALNTSSSKGQSSRYSTIDQQGRHFNSPKESSRNKGTMSGDNGSNSSSSNRHSAILVRNLPLRSTDSSLKDGLFFTYKKHGKVVSVKVVGEGNDRYAIVTFRKYYGNSDIQKAIDATNNIMFFGSKIDVEQAPANFLDVDDNERKPLEKDIDQFHPRSSRTLYVGNLENRATPDQLRHFFERFGDVVDVDIKNRDSPAPFAFVQFTDILSVVKAIHAMEQDGYIGNNKVKVGFGKPLPSPMVWMCELPDHVSSEYLSRKMNFYGAITDILIDKVLHQSLITYDCIESAQAAVQDMKGRTVCNRKVQIDFCSRELHDLFVDRMFRTNQLRGREAAVYLTTSADGAVLTATTTAAPAAGANSGAVVPSAATILPPPPLPSTAVSSATLESSSTAAQQRVPSSSSSSRVPSRCGGNFETNDFSQTDNYYSSGPKNHSGKRNDTTKRRNDAQYENRHSRPSNAFEDHESQENRQRKHRGRSCTPPPIPNRRSDDKLSRNAITTYRRTGFDDRPLKSQQQQQQQQTSSNNRGGSGLVREPCTSASRRRRRSLSPASRNGGRSAPFSPRTPPETRRRPPPSAQQYSNQGRHSRRDRSPEGEEKERRYATSRHSSNQNAHRHSRRSSSSSNASDDNGGGDFNDDSSSISSRSTVSSIDDRNSIEAENSSSTPTPTLEDI